MISQACAVFPLGEGGAGFIQEAQACFTTRLRRTFLNGISKRYVKAIYSKRYSEFQLSACALGLISYSGFSVVPAVPGFADFFS